MLLGARVLATADDTVPVWGARTALVSGQLLSRDDLVPVQVRFPEAGAADRYVAAGGDLPEGLLLTRDVGAGELLPRAATTQGPAEELVEVPVPVPAVGIPSSVEVGSRVDVWVTPLPGGPVADGRVEDGARTEAVLVLSDVPVLAHGGADAEAGFGGELRPVVLGVPTSAHGDLPRVLARIGEGTAVLVRRQG